MILAVTRAEFADKLLPAVPPEHRGIVCMAAGSGLRWGECAGLPWDAVDLDRAELHVRQVAVESSGRICGTAMRRGWSRTAFRSMS
jgi:integrase